LIFFTDYLNKHAGSPWRTDLLRAPNLTDYCFGFLNYLQKNVPVLTIFSKLLKLKEKSLQ